MKREKKTPTQRYFSQKSMSVLDIVCVALLVVCGIVATFVWGGIPMATPAIIVLVCVLVASRTRRVKDSEIDAIVEQMLKASELDDRCTVKAFDMNAMPKIKGKDNKYRTSFYYAICFEPLEENVRLKCIKLDLIGRDTCTYEYIVKRGEIKIEKRNIQGLHKEYAFLCHPSFDFDIPVHTDDIRATELIEKNC